MDSFSRPSFEENDRTGTYSLQTSIDSNPSEGIESKKPIGAEGSAQIPQTETDTEQSIGSSEGYFGIQKREEKVPTKTQSASNSAGSEAVTGKTISRPGTTYIDDRRIGLVGSDQIPVTNSGYSRFLESSRNSRTHDEPDLWHVLDQAKPSMDNHTQGPYSFRNSNGVSSVDSLNLSTFPPLTAAINGNYEGNGYRQPDQKNPSVENLVGETMSGNPSLSFGSSNCEALLANYMSRCNLGQEEHRFSNGYGPAWTSAIACSGALVGPYRAGAFNFNNVGQDPFLYSSHGETMKQNSILKMESEGNLEVSLDRIFMHYLKLLPAAPQLVQKLWDHEIQRMAIHQIGSLCLQKILAVQHPEATELIFNVLLGSIDQLMIDQFGHYVFMALLDYCNETQIEKIVHMVTMRKGALFIIGCDPQGTYSVQKLIRRTKKYNHLISCVTSALTSGVPHLMMNVNGTHVVDHCLIHLNSHQIQFLFKNILEHSLTLATDKRGYLSLTKSIDKLERPYRQALLAKIAADSMRLTEDPYGNFVMQHVLRLNIPEVVNAVCNELKGHFVWLSMQKSSSNVVERCIESSGIEIVLLELMTSGKLGLVARDPFGNYVIQRALKTAKGALLKCLEDCIRVDSQSLKTHPYGRFIFKLVSP